MRFYDREKELGILQNNWEQTAEQGRMTVLIGRRRIGKTTLLTKSAEDGGHPLLYLYVSKDNERVVYVARSRCIARLREIIAEINREDPGLQLNWNPAE